MKRKLRINITWSVSCIWGLLLPACLHAQVTWPVPVSAGKQPTITGTVGEYRDSDRFHRGTDVVGINSNVHPINSGQISKIGVTAPPQTANAAYARSQYILIGGIMYFHTEPLESVLPRALWPDLNARKLKTPVSVTAGTTMGSTISAAGWDSHAHIQKSTAPFTNYLLDGFGTTGFIYTDNDGPVVAKVSSNSSEDDIRFYKDPIVRTSLATSRLTNRVDVTDANKQPVKATEVFGKIDVAAKVGDYRTNPDGNGIKNIENRVGVYKLAYQLFSLTTGKEYPQKNNYQFDSAPNNSDPAPSKAFGPGTTQAVPIWIVSNRREGDNVVEDNWNSTESNQEAVYPDGVYKLLVKAEDIRQQKGEGIAYAWLNNVRAFISRVVARVDGNIAYDKSWKLDPATNFIKPEGTGGTVGGKTQTITLEVFTSEPVKSLQLNFDNKNYSPVPGKSDNGLLWIFTVDRPDFANSTSNERLLTFTGNNFDGTGLVALTKGVDAPQYIGRINGGFTSSPGPDTYHSLSFCSSSTTTLDLNFDKLSETSVRVKATGGKQPYEYRIGSQDFIENSDFAGLSPDQTYQFTVKDDDGCQKSKEYSFKKSTCSIAALSGGQGGATNDYELGINGGTVRISYEMYSIPDQMDVYFNGGLVATTGGLVSGANTLQFAYNPKRGDPTQCRVNMIAPNNGTQWNYTLYCPVGTGPGRVGIGDADYITNYERTSIGYQLRLSSKSTNTVSESYQLLYRYVGETSWTEKTNITLPYTLALTETNREVEVQLIKQEKTFANNSFPIRLYPNPSAGELTLNYEAPEAGLVTLVIQSLKGQVLFEQTWTVLEGTNQRQLTMPVSMVTGHYVLKLQQGDAIHATQLVLVR